MTDNKLSHTKWDCKYHIVFIPKYRNKAIYGKVRSYLKDALHRLASQKGSIIEEGYLMKDHVHMLISIPPKYSVSSLVGYLKGKTAIFISQKIAKRKLSKGYHFWARGYFVSTVGFTEKNIREYIKNQEKRDKELESRDLFNY